MGLKVREVEFRLDFLQLEYGTGPISAFTLEELDAPDAGYDWSPDGGHRGSLYRMREGWGCAYHRCWQDANPIPGCEPRGKLGMGGIVAGRIERRRAYGKFCAVHPRHSTRTRHMG